MCHAVIFTWSWNVRMPVISHLHQANFGPALLILTNSHLSFLNQAFYEYKYQTTSIFFQQPLYSSNNVRPLRHHRRRHRRIRVDVEQHS